MKSIKITYKSHKKLKKLSKQLRLPIHFIITVLLEL